MRRCNILRSCEERSRRDGDDNAALARRRQPGAGLTGAEGVSAGMMRGHGGLSSQEFTPMDFLLTYIPRNRAGCLAPRAAGSDVASEDLSWPMHSITRSMLDRRR
jgi:hypothetical protein